MSATPRPPDASRWTWLPAWARPLEHERRGLGSLRLAESTILILLGVFLAVATVNDLVVLRVNENHRLRADLHTWRTVTGHDYVNISTEQDIKGYTTRDVVCGNVSPGAPGSRNQICLIVTGPVRGGERAVEGGYYLPAYRSNLKTERFWCFGSATTDELCGSASAPPGSQRIALKGERR
jgi:hypothetical protein